MTRSIRVELWLLGCAALAAAAAVVPARADEPATVVWYRAGDGCPTAPEFLAKVAQKSRNVRLATGGEHIDFVVTLLENGTETIGRLERQTQAGTVAIRQLKDASCERVANALALSLGLAIAPTAAASSLAAGDAATGDAGDAGAVQPATATSAPEPATSAPAAQAAPPAPVAAPSASTTQASATPTSDAERRLTEQRTPAVRHWLAAQGGLEFGVLPTPLARARAYFEQAPGDDIPLRFGVLGRLGTASTAVGPVKRWILAADFGACPVLFDPRLVPCAGFELGATGASDSRPTSRSEVRAWLAPSLALRGSLEPARGIRLELEAGSSAPLVRSDLYAGDVRIYQEKPFTFHADIGLSADLW